MNLLAKDKYRTKILQHVLQQCDYDSSHDHFHEVNYQPIDTRFDSLQNLKNHSQNIYSSILFDKVSKQKPLISDTEDIPSCQKQIHTKLTHNKATAQNPNPSKQNNLTTNQHKSNPKPTAKLSQHQKDMLAVFNQPRSQLHLHKQAYTYHQKLPLISISNECNEQFMRKARKDERVAIANKENRSKDINIESESEVKGKKYRFISADKVAEAMKCKESESEYQEVVSRETALESSGHNDNSVNGKDEKSESSKFEQTHRSKGSRQMMEFLESAREKLFSSLKGQSLQFDKANDEEEADVGTKQCQNESETIQAEQLSQKMNKNVGQQQCQSFKIEIQVSARKSCELSLSLCSDPEQISRTFILSNKQELSTFTDIQIKKLQQLLSKKIRTQIQKHRHLFYGYKAEDKYSKNHAFQHDQQRKHQQQKRHEQQQKVQTNSRVPLKQLKMSRDQPNMNKKKHPKTPLQFSHIYIENIDQPQVDTHTQQPHQTDICKYNTSKLPSQTPQLNKLISFNPTSDPSAFDDSCKQQISLDGYINSPHQLITHRPYESGTINQQPSQNLQGDQHENKQQPIREVSHFPLSASISEHPLSKDTQQHYQIGASKILSKSRSKLNKFKKQLNFQHLHPLQAIEVSNPAKQSPNQTQVPPKHLEQAANRQPANPLSSNSRTINSISSQIISRVGKQTILNSVKEKELNKREVIMKLKQAKQLQQLQECSFQPKINTLSKSIDENKNKKIKIGDLIDSDSSSIAKFNNSQFYGSRNMHYGLRMQGDTQSKQNAELASSVNKLSKSRWSKQKSRHEQLYQNHKSIQARKEYTRQKSIESISFKPQINKISKKIIQTKRHSLNNSTYHQNPHNYHQNPHNYHQNSHNHHQNSHTNSKTISKHHSTCKKPQHKRLSAHHLYDEDNELHHFQHKRKSMNASRNLEGLEIGDYLYKEAMRMKKKKQSFVQPKPSNFKPLQKSLQLVNKINQTQLTQSFYHLLNITETTDHPEYDFLLKPESIDLTDPKITTTHLKYLLPLLQQLKQLDVTLTKQEFIESGLKLISCLAPDEKAQFLGKKLKDQEPDTIKKQEPKMNRFSQQIVDKKQYYLQDIYHRGILYKKQIKEKIELDMESKVRQELQKCTFKPKINSDFHPVE